MTRWRVLLGSIMVVAAACGDYEAARVAESDDAPEENFGEWASACEAYCEFQDACNDTDRSGCVDQCEREQENLRPDCQVALGAVMECGAELGCSRARHLHWRQLAGEAVQDPGHPCHDLALEIGPDCCI